MLEAVNLTYKLLNGANPYDLPSTGGLSFSNYFHPEKSRLNVGQHETIQAKAARKTADPIGGAVLGKACDCYGRVPGG